MGFSNGLSEAQLERLVLLSEELGEVIQAIGKIIRHGYASVNPTMPPDSPTNRQRLERELGGVAHAVKLMVNAGDVTALAIECHRNAKAARVETYLHHQ